LELLVKRATFSDILAINAYWVGLSFMWNSLHVIILPAVLLHLVPDTQKNTYLGLLTFFGLVIAMIVQPISGAVSDRWSSRWGRRRPLILIGTAFDFVFLAFLGWSGGLGWLALGYIGLQLSSNTAHGPVQGLLPDRIPADQIGWASGFKNLMDMSGLVAASLLVGHLLSPEVRHPIGVVGLVAFLLAASAAVTLLGAHEASSIENKITDKEQADGWTKYWKDLLHVNIRAHSSYWWLILSRFLFLTGIYGIQTFAQYYIRDVLAAPNPIALTGNLLAAITLSLIIFAIAGGWLGDRLGHKRILLIASAIGALGCLLLLWARTPMTLLVFGSVLGVGIGLFLTSNWALANQQAPLAEAGKFLGLTNLATAGAGALGRLEGPLIDILNNSRPGIWMGYTLLFIFGTICILLSAWMLRRVRVSRYPAPPSHKPEQYASV
jgi:MFS family permease